MQSGNRVTLMHASCDGQISIRMGEMKIAGKAHEQQSMLLLANAFTRDAIGCRDPTGLSSEPRFKVWSPIFWLNLITTSRAAATQFGDDPTSVMEREVFENRVNMPPTCSTLRWQTDGKCQLKFGGLSSFLSTPTTLYLQVCLHCSSAEC